MWGGMGVPFFSFSFTVVRFPLHGMFLGDGRVHLCPFIPGTLPFVHVWVDGRSSFDSFPVGWMHVDRQAHPAFGFGWICLGPR
eukprot:scaffold221_cov351-Pavlova_lutheri.AAC.3